MSNQATNLLSPVSNGRLSALFQSSILADPSFLADPSNYPGEEEEDKTCWTCKKEYEVEPGRGGYDGHECFDCFEKENGADTMVSATWARLRARALCHSKCSDEEEDCCVWCFPCSDEEFNQFQDKKCKTCLLDCKKVFEKMKAELEDAACEYWISYNYCVAQGKKRDYFSMTEENLDDGNPN